MPKKSGYTSANLYKKGSKNKTQKAPMTKASVAKIAKQAVKSVAERKFMNTENTLVQLSPTRPTGNHYISAIGYSTTVGNDNNGTPMVYGGQPIKEMLCLRPFRADNAESDLGAMRPDGKNVTPVSCKSRWRINRSYTSLPETAEVSGATDFPPGLGNTLPVICRMIRITPKGAKGTETELDPDTDAFQDEYGRKTGISADSFDSAELLFYKINTRRYHVIEDRNFILKTPVTVNYTATRLNNSNDMRYTPIISNTNGNCEKMLTSYHQLSERKGGTCYYSDPFASSTDNATSGMRREYTLWHFTHQGGEYITGPTPTGETQREQGPLDVHIDLINTTKFIDV